MSPDDLTQDIAIVGLRNGYCVDVGWYPEHDPSGEFWIRVFWECWNNQVIEPIRTRDAYQAARLVEQLVATYNGCAVPVCQSSNTNLIASI